jgi:RNA polymerase sigma-70 factor, ECF subfamily
MPPPPMPSSDEVAGALLEARRAWPTIGSSLDQLSAFVQAAGVTSADLAVRAPDLVLACASAAGDPVALGLFHAMYVVDVGRALSRLQVPVAVRAELPTNLWMRLFGGDRPKIRSYSGKGPLGAWVRVVATRLAIDMRSGRDRQRELTGDTSLASAVAEGLQPELAMAQRRYSRLLEEALAQAIARLDPGDRLLLRRHFLEGMTIDGLAALLFVHRATVARRIVKLQKQLLAEVSARLSVDLGSSPSEVRSLMDALKDELHLSLSRLLPAATAPQP